MRVNRGWKWVGSLAAFVVVWPGGGLSAETHESQVEWRIFELVNAQRQQLGKGALKRQPPLDQAASEYALFLAKKDLQLKMPKDTTAHMLDGSNPWVRVTKAGYNPADKGVGFSENLAYCHFPTTSDPGKAAFDWWMKSAGHKENLENGESVDTGIGCWKSNSGWLYSVQVYAKPAVKLTAFSIKVVNKTKQTLKFRLGGHGVLDFYTLAPGQTGSYKAPVREGESGMFLETPHGTFGQGFLIYDGKTYEIHPRPDGFYIVIPK
jgi:uncharacterized protein YkwD